MNQPSPCPQCHSDRIWARAALGAYGISHVAFCPGCARAATLCGRCGGELTLVRQSSFATGRARVETVLQCPACRQTAAAMSALHPAAEPRTVAPSRWAGATAAPPAGAATLPAHDAFTGTSAPVTQRVADDVETMAAHRYVRRRHLLDLVVDAARRADAMARLEIELRLLPRPRPEA